MKRRDSETKHEYADAYFKENKIYDLQGLLRENETYTCGVESYVYPMGHSFDPTILNYEEESARYRFCLYLNIPYYIIAIEQGSEVFEIYLISENDNTICCNLNETLNKSAFVCWWKQHQSFTQKKEMTEAAPRIEGSIIDNILFANNLAWGVNIDGFTLDTNGKPLAIFEKRITNKSQVEQYDPRKYFFGTNKKSGDFPSWNILKTLADHLEITLYLLTFERSNRKIMGKTQIKEVHPSNGLTYTSPIKFIIP
ncbi:hypothetical protein [Sphingobacterium paucimobilis]|uniref:Uncharacterized protein n=1 Tax=Sphingobacterium paucimobilis HER1398 TaxID=1346330 RepID=U2J490_9SPHI|nr:hypothetical protein [Sphingobacterium paucimobilis]ERJ57468.1 hypothetical protein M472_01680 [Sphingobacterium paucimobilis HER1398]